MNYYIQGNKKNANKIKVAFEAKGIDTSDWEFINPCDLYFNVGNKIYTIDISIKHIIIGRHDYTYLELSDEPKFKVDDWVVFNNIHNSIYQISEIKDYSYMLTHIYGGSMSLSFSQEKLIRPWTIEDAVDGDVLLDEGTGTLGIFEKILKTHWRSKIYCGNSDYPVVYEDGGAHEIKATKPATKEQRDLFFSKIKEAGYEWDEKKKKVRKINFHYDISNFHAGMPVLVREYDTCVWQWVLYSHFNGVGLFFAAGKTWRQCIPINDDTKHLLGTTDMCPEEYINW